MLDSSGRSVDHAEDELLEAMRSSDIAALDRLIADDLTFTGPDGAPLSKQADLDAHRSGATRFERIDPIDRRSQEQDDHSATTETTALAVVVIDGVATEVRLRWRRTWQVVDGRWQVRAGSVTVLDR